MPGVKRGITFTTSLRERVLQATNDKIETTGKVSEKDPDKAQAFSRLSDRTDLPVSARMRYVSKDSF